MKKRYTILALVMMFAIAATAQKKVNVKFTIENPASGSTIVLGSPFSQKVIATILGPGALAADDTLFMHDPFNNSGQIWYYLNNIKAVNDTIQFIKQYTPSTANPNGPFNYCVYGYIRKGAATTNDSMLSTTPSQTCNMVNFQGGSVGITAAYLIEQSNTEHLSVFPNPAFSTITLAYKAKNVSEVTARILDITGREVLIQNFGSAYIGQSGYQVDISNLGTGIYFIEVRQEGIRAVGRVSKK